MRHPIEDSFDWHPNSASNDYLHDFRLCKKCKRTLPLNEKNFRKYFSNKLGREVLRNTCIVCENKRRTELAQAGMDEKRAKNAAYYAEHRDAVLLKRRLRRAGEVK